MYSYAPSFEDVLIYKAFQDVQGGFYMDVGAYDPNESSVTKLFYDAGWSGVNVEPGPSFTRFVESRIRDINLNVAVAESSGRARFYYHEGNPRASTLKQRLSADLKSKVGVRRLLDVETISLTDLLERYGAVRPVHFLKLDVEGIEAKVVGSVDWRVQRPELFITRATRPYTNIRVDGAWAPLLRRSGYELVFFDGTNTYHLREESSARRTAFLDPARAIDGFVKVDRRIDGLVTESAPLRNVATQTGLAVITFSRAPRKASDVATAGGSLEPAQSEVAANSRLVAFSGENECGIAGSETQSSLKRDYRTANGVRSEMAQRVKSGSPRSRYPNGAQRKGRGAKDEPHNEMQSRRENPSRVIAPTVPSPLARTVPLEPLASFDEELSAVVSDLAAIQALRTKTSNRSEIESPYAISAPSPVAEQAASLSTNPDGQSRQYTPAYDALEKERKRAEAAALSAAYASVQHAQERQRRLDAEGVHAITRSENEAAREQIRLLSARADHFEQITRDLQARAAEVHAQLLQANERSEINYNEAQRQRLEKEEIVRATEERVQQAAQGSAAALLEMQRKEIDLQRRLEQALQQAQLAEVDGTDLRARASAAEALAQRSAAEIQLLIEENAVLRREAVTAEASITAAEISAQTFAAQLQRASDEAAVLRQEKVAAESALAAAQASAQTATAELQRALNENVILRQELSVTTESSSAALALVQKIKGERVSLEQMLASVRSEADRSLAVAVDRTREQEAAHQLRLGAAAEENQQLSAQVGELGARLSANSEALEAARVEGRQLAAENAELQLKLETARSEADRVLAATLDEMRQEQAALEARVIAGIAEKQLLEARLVETYAVAQTAAELQRQLASAAHEATVSGHRLDAARLEHAVMLEAVLERPLRELRLVEAALAAAHAEIRVLSDRAVRADRLEDGRAQLAETVRDLQAQIAIAEREHAVVIDAMLDRPLREVSILQESLSSALSRVGQLGEEVAALQAQAGYREQQFKQQMSDNADLFNIERAALQSELIAVRDLAVEAEALRHQLDEMQASYETELARARGAVDAAEAQSRQARTEMQRRHEYELAAVRGESRDVEAMYRDQLEDMRRNYEGDLADQDAERAYLALELAQANDAFRHVETKHALLAESFSEAVAERDALYHDLKLTGGPRALRLVLPIARVIRLLGGQKRKSAGSPHASAGSSRVKAKADAPVGVRAPSGGIARATVVPVVLWVARRFPKQTRSLWMDMRARAPAELLHPPSVEIPTPVAVAPAWQNGTDTSDPLLARRVHEALLTMTLHNEMQSSESGKR